MQQSTNYWKKKKKNNDRIYWKHLNVCKRIMHKTIVKILWWVFSIEVEVTKNKTKKKMIKFYLWYQPWIIFFTLVWFFHKSNGCSSKKIYKLTNQKQKNKKKEKLKTHRKKFTVFVDTSNFCFNIWFKIFHIYAHINC